VEPVGQVVGTGSTDERGELFDGMVGDGEAGEHHAGVASLTALRQRAHARPDRTSSTTSSYARTVAACLRAVEIKAQNVEARIAFLGFTVGGRCDRFLATRLGTPS